MPEAPSKVGIIVDEEREIVRYGFECVEGEVIKSIW